MGFSNAIDKAMNSWFAAGFADTVTLNGEEVQTQVIERDTEEATQRTCPQTRK